MPGFDRGLIGSLGDLRTCEILVVGRKMVEMLSFFRVLERRSVTPWMYGRYALWDGRLELVCVCGWGLGLRWVLVILWMSLGEYPLASKARVRCLISAGKEVELEMVCALWIRVLSTLLL